MSYCIIQKILLSLYLRGFTPVWCPAGHENRLIFEEWSLKAHIDELCWVGGCLARKWINKAVIRRLSGGANL